MPSPPSYGCCTRVNFVLKKHLLFQMNLSNSGLKNRSIKEYWLIFTVLKFPLGLQFSHNLTKFKIIKYISTIYIMTTTCTYLQQLTQVSEVAHGPLVLFLIKTICYDPSFGLSPKRYVMTPHLDCLVKTVQVRGHNICCSIPSRGKIFLTIDGAPLHKTFIINHSLF